MTESAVVPARSNRDLLAIAGLAILVVAVYFQAKSFGFINLDDNLYVYDNPAIANGLSLDVVKWAFTSFWSANWHPLTWLSHALDVQLFGMNAGMHHIENVILHLINSILAFIVFRKMTGRQWESLIVAALFAVHPAHVESVAWVSERKDVLSTMFWLLTMWAYIRWTREGEKSPNKPNQRFLSANYLLIVFLFGLGLLAKPMLVTLPFVLLVCDFWPLKRPTSLKDLLPRVAEKLPLFALAAASSVVTFIAQRSSGAVESLDSLPLQTRLFNALISYAKYVVTFFYPTDLAVWYPYENVVLTWEVTGSILLLSGITILCIWQFRERPFLIAGWLWFLGTLVPVIGFVQVGSQALADRYTYVPYFGLLIMVVWGAASLVETGRFRQKAFAVAAALAVVVFAALAHHQASYWLNNETLYRHVLDVTSNNYLVDHNLCHYLMQQDRLDEAEPFCRRSLEIRPQFAEAWNTVGIVDFKRGRYAEAQKSFEQALLFAPNYAYPWLNLSQTQARQGRPEEAEESVRRAVESSGGSTSNVFVSALTDVALTYSEQDKWDKSAVNLRRLIYIEPNNPEPHALLAYSLYSLKQFDDAEAEVQNALSLKPDMPEAWNTHGLILLEQKRNKDAAEAFEKALNIRPDFPEAKANLARAQGKS